MWQNFNQIQILPTKKRRFRGKPPEEDHREKSELLKREQRVREREFFITMMTMTATRERKRKSRGSSFSYSSSSAVLSAYANQTLKPIGIRINGECTSFHHRAREERSRLLSILKTNKTTSFNGKVRDEIALLEKLCKNSHAQHRRSKLFQSVHVVVKEVLFLLKTVNAQLALAKLEKGLHEHFEEEKKDKSKERETILVPPREQLAVCVNALRATAFGIGGGKRGVREKIRACGIHATTEISRSFFVPFATVVLSSLARVQILVFQWCAECAELHNVLAGFGGCLPSSSSRSFGEENGVPKTNAFKEELVVEWEKEKTKKNKEEEEDDEEDENEKEAKKDTSGRFKDVVPRVRAFESGNDIFGWDENWAPLLVSSPSRISAIVAQRRDSSITTETIANEKEDDVDLGAKIDREGLTKPPTMTKPSPATTTVSLGLGVPLVDVDKDLQKKIAQSKPNYKDGQGRDASGKRSLDAAMTKKEKKLRKKEEMEKKQKLAVDPVARLKAIFEG